MGTFIQITLVIYILYYTGNIVYDLFLKKEKISNEQQDKQEFSLEYINNEVTNVEMDEVEDMTTTSKMEINEEDIFSLNDESYNGEASLNSLDSMKTKFENEEKMENGNKKNNDESTDEDNTGGKKIDFSSKKEIVEKNKNRWKDFMNLAETSIQIVKTPEGEKIHKSTMIFK